MSPWSRGRAPQEGDRALAVFVTEMESKYEGQWPRAKFEALAKSRPTVFLGLRMGETKKLCARQPYIPAKTSMIAGVELFHFGYGNLPDDAQCNMDAVAQLQKLCRERTP